VSSGGNTWAGAVVLILVGVSIVIRTGRGQLIPALRRTWSSS
jgi:hypothetical protein